MTADNASNNAMMMDKLEQLFEDDLINFEAPNSTIRCLAHVIHLAVMALLISVKAVKKKEVHNEIDFSEEWDEEVAEKVGYGGKFDALGKPYDDDELLKNQSNDDVDLTSAIQKVHGAIDW
jgi:hypothetical protein